MKTIGVLALQGAIHEHISIIKKMGHHALPIKHPEDLKTLDGLILPGGESTTMRHLMKRYHFIQPIKDFAKEKKGIFGTCAGMVLAAKTTLSDEENLNLLDGMVIRNGFGRQKESFETNLTIPVLGDKPFQAIFIRAPFLTQLGKNVKVLAAINEKVVVAHENNVLVTAFHPELTNDTRLLEYFIENCC
ncbi:pyridoxal 5'-phosphate synthase glutaminase subunit PdxT [Listeria sp. PSOL-1]|uniref:pyridoxal 5'-phosphate synthase glutaminase subunit PdxT n=1 Tax=Listeria sp. PSOL-1 TaxID=1844999 RepID=UPI0013CFF39F|nr:pyridoxal 5'-phosphate synthase glutaminase subunit PdxT [Listeria sp. PSOL-1]